MAQPAWTRELWHGLKAHFLLKMVAAWLLAGVFFIGYFLLLKFPLWTPTLMPVTALDRWIAFSPAALWLYVSLWLYVPLVPGLLTDRAELLDYYRAMIALSLAGMSVFLFWPTASPRPVLDWAQYPPFGPIIAADDVGNALPSLHAAFAVFSAIWMDRLLRRAGAPRALQLLSAIWAAGIVYSTLATRQHVVVDVATGATLGGLAAWLHRRWRDPQWRPLRVAAGGVALCLVVLAAGGGLLLAWPWWGVALPALAGVALLADGILRPSSQLFYPTVTHGPRGANRVALSFDDGPDPQVTPAVLDMLAAHGARATFFVIGRHVAAYPQLAQRIAAEGHELGNHSWEHSRWRYFFSMAAQRTQMERGAAAISALTGTHTTPLYRPPMGLKPPPLARAARALGLTLIGWSVHSKDTRSDDPARIARQVLDRIEPGAIVLMHDGHDLPGRHRPVCAPALRLILEGLAARGLQCVTVSELLQPA